MYYWNHERTSLVAYLEKLGHKDDTVVIVVSDHGEEFWEHRGTQHAKTLYQEVPAVPSVSLYKTISTTVAAKYSCRIANKVG